MMHRPSIPELLKPGQSYYSLVVGVAKRAREIAVDDFAKGKCKLVESDTIGIIYDCDISQVDSIDLDEE